MRVYQNKTTFVNVDNLKDDHLLKSAIYRNSRVSWVEFSSIVNVAEISIISLFGNPKIQIMGGF